MNVLPRARVKARPISPTWVSVVATMPFFLAWASLRACPIDPSDPSHVVFQDGEEVDDIEDGPEIGLLSRFVPERMIECEGEMLVLQIRDEPFEVLGHLGDFQDFAKLAAVESVNIDMEGMPHLFAIQDLDFDGRDEALASPADLVISVHGVVIGKRDIGHAEPPRFLIECQRIDVASRDDVVRMKRVDMEVSRCPAFSHEISRFIDLENRGLFFHALIVSYPC